MSAELEILGVTSTTDTGFVQPKEEAVDISQYTEAALMLTVYALNRNSGTTTIKVETAVDNQDDRYIDLAELADLTSDPGAFPATYMIYLAGPGVAGTGQPGFARFMRVALTQAAGASITLDCRAILKP